MNDWHQYIAAGLPTVAVLLAIWRADKRADQTEARLGRLEARLDRSEARLEARLDKVDADLRHFFELLGRHDEAIETLKKRAM